MALSIYLGRHWMAALYTTDSSVMLLAAQIMLWAAAFQLVDASQSTAIGALRGYKDTRIPMVLALIAYWLIGFPVAVVFGLGLLGAPVMGVHGFWMGLSLGLAVACVALISRFAWLSQRQRVIEQLSLR